MKKNFLSIVFVISIIYFISISFSCVSLDGIAKTLIGIQTKNAEERIVDAVLTSVEDIAEASNFTPEETYQLGRAVAASAIGNNDLYQNDELSKYLNSICQSIVINSNGTDPFKGYFVGVIDSEIVNAFATPGGHILITRGMLKNTNSEDELAAVIAHEISHIQLNHSMKAISKNAWSKGLTNIAVSPFADELLSNAFSSITTTLLDSGYSKTTEYEADENAIILMQNTGYNPNAMFRMLESLDKNSKSNYSLGFGKTHPEPKERIRKANKTIKQVKTIEENYNYNEESRISRFEIAKEYF